MRKKVIILWHSGGRMANQLWLFMSVYAYCLEMKYKLENHCFFEYAENFNISANNFIINLSFYKSFVWFKNILPKYFYRNQHDYFFRWYYKVYLKFVIYFNKENVIYADHYNEVKAHYLRPSKNTDIKLTKFEDNNKSKIYFHGWLFRNPIGIIKYRKEIVEFFKPKDVIIEKANTLVVGLRINFKTIVGVHIRQGDYKNEFRGGELYFNETEVFDILNQYLAFNKKNTSEVCFLICSDGPIDLVKLSSLNVFKTSFGPVEDLYSLAQTDTIIGSDSTFGAFASYYGNIPFIIFKKDVIDWGYYSDKNYYFENKYSSVVCY